MNLRDKLNPINIPKEVVYSINLWEPELEFLWHRINSPEITYDNNMNDYKAKLGPFTSDKILGIFYRLDDVINGSFLRNPYNLAPLTPDEIRYITYKIMKPELAFWDEYVCEKVDKYKKLYNMCRASIYYKINYLYTKFNIDGKPVDWSN